MKKKINVYLAQIKIKENGLRKYNNIQFVK
jgi:hypothetical protein